MAEESKLTRKELAQSIALAASKGNSIERSDPAKAARVLEMIADNVPWRQIMERESVGWYTLVGLRARHAALVDKRREMIAQDTLELMEGMRFIQHEKIKMLAEDENALRRVNIRDLAMAYGMFADKFFMATDGNKVVVEHRSGAPSIEDAKRAIEAARAKMRKASVEVDVTPKDVSYEKQTQEDKGGEAGG